MIGLIDYDAGNLFSVRRALEHVGAAVRLVSTPADMRGLDRIVLPGVGAFGSGIARLHETGLHDALLMHLHEKGALLGICLGMQLLCRTSTERGEHVGLGVFDAAVERLPDTGTVPHMGWNDVSGSGPVDGNMYAYFAHSYYISAAADGVVATSDHSVPVAAAMQRDRVWGVQFHPEKSGPAGLALLKRFAETA
ncbi:MAG: glutamine amidotransferase [Myxococcota bacterium]